MAEKDAQDVPTPGVHFGLSDDQMEAAGWVVDTPRSLAACAKAGIDHAQLVEPQLSDFEQMAVTADIAKLQWSHAKQRVQRNRKLARKYHALELSIAGAHNVGDSEVKAATAINERVKRLRDENRQISMSASQSLLRQSQRAQQLQEEAERKQFQHFAKEVQGPLSMYKKQTRRLQSKGKLHTPQGHVERARKYQALREEEARQERVKAQELFEFEAQNRWCKEQLLQSRQELVKAYGESRDQKQHRMQEASRQRNQDISARKRQMYERTEEQCESAALCKHLFIEERRWHTKERAARAKSRADEKLAAQAKAEERARHKLRRSHTLMDLKHDKLAFERSEKQRQQQIRGRIREIDTQRRVEAANKRKQDWTDRLLLKMHNDDQRVQQLQEENASKLMLHQEQNRLVRLERKQRKADIDRWNSVEEQMRREVMELKDQRSDKLLQAKSLLAKQLSQAQHSLIKERDAIDNELLLRQTTGSWEMPTERLLAPSRFSSTAPLPTVAASPRPLSTVAAEALDINITSTAQKVDVDLSPSPRSISVHDSNSGDEILPSQMKETIVDDDDEEDATNVSDHADKSEANDGQDEPEHHHIRQ